MAAGGHGGARIVRIGIGRPGSVMLTTGPAFRKKAICPTWGNFANLARIAKSARVFQWWKAEATLAPWAPRLTTDAAPDGTARQNAPP